MKAPLISIIVPVYNVEPYIETCLNSILTQSLGDFEVIVVNDGSSDNSLALCEHIASENPQVKIISQPNQGVSEARNTGISAASGRYIAFVDSDDWVEPEYLELLYRIAQEHDADISISGRTLEEYRRPDISMDSSIVVYEGTEALTALYVNKDIRDHLWGKLIKRELFDGIRFPTGKTFEDIFVMYRLFARAKCVVKVDTPTYHYISRPNSITSFSHSAIRRFYDWLESLETQAEFIASHPENFSDPEMARSALAIKLYRLKKVMIKTLISVPCTERDELERSIDTSLKTALAKATVSKVGILRYLNCCIVLYFPGVFYTLRRLRRGRK